MASATRRTQECDHAPVSEGGQDSRGDAMNTKELQRTYGDSHTLDCPTGDEASEQFYTRAKNEQIHPLDHPDVVEDADSQGWGN